MKKFLTILSICLVVLMAGNESYSQPTEQWGVIYNGLLDSIDVAKDIVVDDSGNTYVTGHSPFLLGLFSDIFTISYDSDGNERWSRGYGSLLLYDKGAAIVLDNTQQFVYVTGFVNGVLDLTGADYVIIKYEASTGNEVWSRTYNNGILGDDKATSIAIDGQNNPIITGYSEGFLILLTPYDYATIKYDQNGIQQWVSRYNGPNNKDDLAYAIAIDNSNNIIITGSSRRNRGLLNSDDDYATVKYNSSGTQQWASRYDNGNNDRAYAIVIDNSGNPIVTGESENSTNYDYATVKYNSTGTQQWASRYNNGNNDRAYAIVIDNSGNPVVTGESEQNAGNSDYATVKYNSAGSQQWASRYNGTGNGNDRAYAIVIDNSGNTYVTGESERGPGNPDYETVKYNSAGSQQWEVRRNGSGNNEDRAYAIVIDSPGNVYITGSSRNSSLLGSEDYLTIKYADESNPVIIISNEVPVKNSLSQNYPNPFNPSTNMKFDVLSQSFVNISVYDILGNKVAIILNNKLNPGTYQAEWNAVNFPSAIYFYRISIGDPSTSSRQSFIETKKMILIK